MKYFSVCSGMEAATLAWKPLGWELIGLCDFAPYPQEFLKHHYLRTPLYSDITLLNYYESYKKTKFDLLVGGTPCQSFSDAGLGKGLDDDRGKVALSFGQILKEKRPKWFVWENVDGVFKGEHKEALCQIITSFIGVEFKPETLHKQGVVQGEEYSIAYRVLDSQYFGVPQRRKRIYVVGYRGKDWRPPFAVLFEEGCFNQTETKDRKKGDVNTKNILREIKLAGTVTKSFATTLTDGFGKNSTSNYWVDERGIRMLTETELERLQGVPDGYTKIPYKGSPSSYSQRKSIIGNSMTVNVMYWIGQRIDYVNKILINRKHKKYEENTILGY